MVNIFDGAGFLTRLEPLWLTNPQLRAASNEYRFASRIKNMNTIKTLVNDTSVEDFINSVDGDAKKTDAFKILEMYKEATDERPKM